MAKYGAKYLQWAPFNGEEPEDALPSYGDPMNLGSLVKVTDAPAFNSAKAYGDNALKEFVEKFKEAPVDVEVLELSNKAASAIFGASLKVEESAEGDLEFGENDTAPYGGLAFYENLQENNQPYLQGIYYPKVKASMQGEEYTTQGDSIALTNSKLKFTASAPNYGKWKIKSKRFNTESEAKAWVDEKIKKTASSG